MKKYIKKGISIFIAVLMLVSVVGGYLPHASNMETVCAANTGTKYMARVTGLNGTGNGYYSLYQSFGSNLAGKTYELSFDYYIKSSSETYSYITAKAYYDTNSYLSEMVLQGTSGTKKYEFTVDSSAQWFIVGFETQPYADGYIWNVSLKEKGTTNELFANSDWTDGTTTGWTMSPSANFEVVAIDKEIEHAPEYMTRVTGLNGTGNGYYSLYQSYGSNLAGKTYELSFDYYIKSSNQTYSYITAKAYYDSNSYLSKTISQGTSGTASYEFTVDSSAQWFVVGFETQPYADGYIWNVSLKEKGSINELFTNSDWADGTTTGWTKSDAANFEVVAYEDFTKLADWSMQPILADTLDVNYKVSNWKLTLKDGTIPTMTFVLYDKEQVVKIEQVEGTLASDGTYQFGFKMLPQQLSNKLVATLSFETTNDIHTQTKAWTVKEYCSAILNDDNSSEKTKDLVADMLRYGAEVQAMFGLENTITSGLETSIEGFGSNASLSDISDFVETLLSQNQTEETYKWMSASLVLDGRVVIRLKFTTTASDISNLKIKVNNTEYTPTVYEDEVYCVDIPVPATCHATQYRAVFYVEEAEKGATLTYSVNTYLHRKKDIERLKNLLTSVYRYGESAESYNITDVPEVPSRDNELVDNWVLE